VVSSRGLCDELITRPEESYRMCCVVVCDLENLKNEEVMTRVGSQRHRVEKQFGHAKEDVREDCRRLQLLVRTAAVCAHERSFKKENSQNSAKLC